MVQTQMKPASDKQNLGEGLEGTPGLTKRLLSVYDGTICVYEAGQEHTEQIVLLHGAMYDESRLIWDAMFPALAARYHVYAVDTPRHGGSRPWSGMLDRARLMAIFEQVFAQLGLKRFSIVGLSMGGGLAIEYASVHQDQVKSMALFEPGGLGERVDLQWLTWLYIKTPGMLRLLSRQYVRYSDEKLEKLLSSIFTKGTMPKDLSRLSAVLKDEIRGKFTYDEQDMDDWQISAIGPVHLAWNLLEETGRIHCPTLWLRGAESKLVKQAEMERAVALLQETGARTELVVVANAGHMLPLEQPEQAIRAVLDFFASVLDQ